MHVQIICCYQPTNPNLNDIKQNFIRLIDVASQGFSQSSTSRHLRLLLGRLKWLLLLLFSPPVMSDSWWPHGLQHARLPCPSPSPRVCSNSCPLSWWCHPIISSSVAPFFSCPPSFPASGSFPISQFSVSDGQSIGASVSASSFQWVFRVDFL